VDDEAVVVEIGKTTLERLGYCVTTGTSRVEALELDGHRKSRHGKTAVITAHS